MAASSSQNPSSTRGVSTPRPPPLDYPALQVASRVLQEQLVKDLQMVPDFADMLTIPGAQSSASYTVFPGDYRVPFQKRKHIGIPPILWEHFNSSKFICHMGILTDIERAWITMDHKLFLWDYVEGQELSSFVEQPDIITHVALVKPKPNVFIDEITSLLVICTPVTVLLLGLSSTNISGLDNRPRKDIKLFATDMSISTDGVEMTSVIGMGDGRIFMCGGSDGHLYELHYQEKEVWFGKKFHLINHSASGMPTFLPILRIPQNEERIASIVADPARGCFYTLSEHNWVSIWMPESNKGLRKIQTLSSLLKQAQDKAPGTPQLMQNFKLISLHIITQRESKSGVQLMALSSNGVRLYFGPLAANYVYGFGGSAYSSADPKQLQLLHVRLPPPNLLHPDEQLQPQHRIAHVPQAGVQQPNQPSCIVSGISTASYVDGLLVAAQPSDVDSKDFILGISPDLTKIASLGQTQQQNHSQPPNAPYYGSRAMGPYVGPTGQPRTVLTEQAAVLYVEGTIWAVAHTTQPTASAVSATPTSTPQPLAINELALQFSEPHREFIIVTNVGISILVKRKALDYLKDAIEEVQADGNVQAIIDFRDSFGRDQTCAMLLALASGNTFISPDRIGSQAPDSVVHVSSELAAIAKQAYFDLGERPVWLDRGFGNNDNQGNVLFSGRRDGLATYFARLIRPIWRSKLTKTEKSGAQSSHFSDAALVLIQKNLYALKAFVDRNPQLFMSAPPGDHLGARTNNEQEAWKLEQASIVQILALLTRSVEAISFILLLIDYNLGDLLSQCDAETQKMVSSLTYEDLITTPNGSHVSRALVNVIINRQIGQQISIDTVSEILQQRCGSFCSADDVMLYKARENIRKSVEVRDPIERQALLGESLRLFSRAARVLEFETLREVVGDYQQLNYAKGAVELPLQCAQVADPDNLGFEFWNACCPPNDSRSEFLEKRLQCYDLILDSLSVFDERSSKPGPQQQDADEVRSHAYDVALSSEDPVFHSHLYEWLIDRGAADALLEIRPPYLEAHLQREPITASNYQLLWQFYVKTGQSLRAAEVLAALAQSTQFDVSLDQRLQFLTLAVSNAKSHPVSVDGKYETAVAFLTELEEQLEVAQVQLEIYSTLLPRINEPGEVGEKIKILQRGLFTISELYQLYAEPFNLPAMKLLILHVSEHRDDAVVRPIWNTLFEDATDDNDSDRSADRIASLIVSYGRRFFPSECAFPLRHVASLLLRFTLAHKGIRPHGWAARILNDAGVPYPDIWDIFHAMYESQVPPFNDQANVQSISSDISVLLKDWVEEARRPQSSISRHDFPVDVIDRAITKYLEELTPGRTETRETFEDVQRQLRRYW
ncbi:nucleoporin [Rickenella mellea]|uniref:Nucleoporin n=1 Tax=Rickenella mellea TaxID=50990 RepID=A0A4Y7QMA0_9AGAM|nr:nucleoporin [Rickenella mellea]